MPAENPLCIEDGTMCNFTDAPFDAMVQPISAIFGAFTYPIIYAVFLGIIWLKTKDMMTTGIIGILMAGAGITSGVIADWNIDIIRMGLLLLGVGVGVVVYQMYITKVQSPTI